MSLNTISINDRLGDGGLENVAILSTDANGNTAMQGGDGFTEVMTAYAGMVLVKPAAFISVPTATPTTMEFDTVVHDPIGIYDAASNSFVLPADIVMLDWEICVELANTASTYGNITGNRVVILPTADGMGTNTVPLVPQTGTAQGGGFVRFNGFGVEWDHGVLGDTFDIKFSQNSGSTIRIGDSSGLGVGQTYFKMRLYRAAV